MHCWVKDISNRSIISTTTSFTFVNPRSTWGRDLDIIVPRDLGKLTSDRSLRRIPRAEPLIICIREGRHERSADTTVAGHPHVPQSNVHPPAARPGPLGLPPPEPAGSGSSTKAQDAPLQALPARAQRPRLIHTIGTRRSAQAMPPRLASVPKSQESRDTSCVRSTPCRPSLPILALRHRAWGHGPGVPVILGAGACALQ